MRLGVVCLIGLLLLALAPGWAQAAPAPWSVSKVMRMIDKTRVRVGERVLRIESESTLCSGSGRAVRRKGVRMWWRFDCTYTTFTRVGVDRDLDFGVRVTGARRFVITNARWVDATRAF
jgi:hypothetical protein